ncbi:IS481 family transposase [Methylorubrum zatmanii]|uniref:IS481 family transposase n=1 Tax=Methylorubrum zatmanii TaxID=29429 RepID=A0ABW1WUU6_9HYPH|nr:IS481 family transposase [Methylorubrum zatmanii]MBD8906644.1 IS481 family transposase [Methylorubrum zatmanii]
MNIHQNARLTPSGRERLVRLARSGLSPKTVAATMGVWPKTVGKCVARFAAEGAAGLQDRSSRPHTLHRLTPIATQEAILALRRQRLTGAQIARDLAVSPTAVSRGLRRHGLSRIRDLEPPPPVQRYERTGHRIIGDRTRQSSGRGIGREYLHLAVDDHSRLAYSEILPDETRTSCLAFLFNALRFFRRHGIGVERVMTDNGPAFKSRRYAKALRRLDIRRKRTRPYMPRTNGKVERFVQTSLREWAYARAYDTSEQRRAELPAFLFHYNWHRPQSGINGSTPISRLGLADDNMLSINI